MRNIFVDEMNRIMREDSRVVFLSAECGFNVVESLAAEFPDRYYNLGIAEQSLVGTAAGVALRGLKPVAYTMAMFLTMRAYEQIRVDVAYQNLPVILAGVIPGLGYGNSGPTHHSIEDAAIMRVLPNMTVIYPGQAIDVRAAARQALQMEGPCYIGLGRASAGLDVSYTAAQFQIGKAIQMTDGRDAAVFAYGAMLPVAVEAAKLLEKQGVSLRVYNMHTVKPLDTAAVASAATECGTILTLEEENIIGGLGGAAAEYLAEHSELACRFKRLGIPDTYGTAAGRQAWLHKQYGIDADSVAEAVKEILR